MSAKDRLKDFMTGYISCRGNQQQTIAELAATTNWQELAKAELTRRATALLTAQDEEILLAIANGEVDVVACAKEVAK